MRSLTTNSALRLFLFGGIRLVHQNTSINVRLSNRELALFAYLAYCGEPIARDHLAQIFWPGRTQKMARSNLRTMLSNLGKALTPYIIISRNTASLNQESDIWLDVAEFKSHIQLVNQRWEEHPALKKSLRGQLEAALALYKADFLASFSLPDSDLFEDWLQQEQAALKQLATNGLWKLITFYEDRKNFDEGVRYANQLLDLDPYDEDAHLRLMVLLAKSGREDLAIVHYQDCEKTIVREFNVPPGDALKEAYQQLLAGNLITFLEPAEASLATEDSIEIAEHLLQSFKTSANLRHVHLPVPLTPLIGHIDLLTRLHQKLIDPACRLLTLTGFGGIGKTHLALSVAQQVQYDYANGVCFIPLKSALMLASRSASDASERLILEIATALNVTFHGDETPLIQLKAYLHQMEMLLIIDNFEHLLAGSQVITELLQVAPEITVLLTSREQLRVNGEVVVPIPPLPYPETLSAQSHQPMDESLVPLLDLNQQPINGYPSVQLFLDRAKRVCPTIEIMDEDWQHIAQICCLVGGVPLAVKLAASWVNHYTFTEIIEEIQHNLPFLCDQRNDLDVRHKHMSFVLEEAWLSLTREGQQLLAQLTQFEGEFSRGTALSATDASVSTLISLVDGGVVQTLSAGCYVVSPLIKRYVLQYGALADGQGNQDAQANGQSTMPNRQLRGLRRNNNSKGGARQATYSTSSSI